jgi:DNA-binding NtrC family response regulator
MNPFNRLLLVTSDADFEQSFTNTFATSFDLTIARSAEAALGHLGRRFYPTLVVDYALPDQKGDVVLAEAQRILPVIQRVLVSATAVPRLADLKAEGVVDLFLPKPFDREEYRGYLLPRERR